ncbi:MAG: hypothetical protein ABIK65_14910 [Candidatus Eisenbacteria bacterium]
MSFRWKTGATLFLVLLAGIGCSERSPNDPDGNGNGNTVKDAPFWTKEGWARYEREDYNGARNAFSNALSKDSLYAPAHSGTAFTNIEFGFTGLALSQFEKGIALDSALVECYYGAAYMAHTQAVAFPNLTVANLTKAAGYAEGGLARGGDAFEFEHHESVNARNLRVLLARTYFALAQYENAKENLDILDPNNGVLSSSATYLQDLLLAIENLEDVNR